MIQAGYIGTTARLHGDKGGCSVAKGPLPAIKAKHRVKRRLKRHHFTSPLLSDEDNVTWDELHTNNLSSRSRFRTGNLQIGGSPRMKYCLQGLPRP